MAEQIAGVNQIFFNICYNLFLFNYSNLRYSACVTKVLKGKIIIVCHDAPDAATRYFDLFKNIPFIKHVPASKNAFDIP